MRGLYEHMSEQDAKIIEQSERLLKTVSKSNGNSVSDKKENGSTLSQVSLLFIIFLIKI